MGTWVQGGNRYLSDSEMTTNAQYILDYMTSKGWTKNAVCGMLGNMQTESTMNPQLWESLDYGNMQGGFGLVQWTPATVLTDWCQANGKDYNNIDSQLDKILSEVTDGSQWIYSGMTFQEFTQSTDTPYNLALIFIKAYERPFNPNQPIRGTQADNWYNTLTGGSSTGASTSTNQVKLIYPYTYNTFNRISYNKNVFNVIKISGNIVHIQNPSNNRKYFVSKSSIKNV